MNCYDLVVLGDVNMDYVVARNLAFPFCSLVENGLIYWEDIKEIPGGSGLNVCVFAQEIGYRCLILGKVGKDSAGIAITEWLRMRQINMMKSWTSSENTGKALIIRDSVDIRLLINNKVNANGILSIEDVEQNKESIRSCRILYVSGYCISDQQTPRHQATLAALSYAKEGTRPPIVVFDVVPHKIYEILSFNEFLFCTKHVDILISEVATIRRFMGLGSKTEIIDQAIADDTAKRISEYFPRCVLRYGPSGCDEEILFDKHKGRQISKATGHDRAVDKRGFGDRLALDSLRDFFCVLPKL